MAELCDEEQPQRGMDLKNAALKEGIRIKTTIDALLVMSETDENGTVAYVRQAENGCLISKV